MTNLIESIKAKIEEAKKAMQANADAKYTEDLKKEIGAHIGEMSQLLAKAEIEGDNATEELKQKIAESTAKLEKALNQ